jgi:O-antigen/teichoic acid export membrane protein
MAFEAVISDETIEELEAAEGSGPAGKESLKSRAIRSSFWTTLSYGTSNVMRLCSNVLLARLLTPDLFGLSNVINLFIQGLHMFSDLGINQSVIQNPRGDEPDFLNTAWTIQAFRGCAVWIASMIIAWPVASFYQIPEFRYLIPIVGFTAVIDGLTSTKYHLRSRHLNLSATVVIDLTCYGITLVVMVVWALFHRTIWAIIAGNMAGSIVKLLLTHFALPGPNNRFCFNKEALRALTHFGRWIFVSTMVTFMAGQADRFIFLKKIPLKMIGLYGISLTLAGTPKEAIIRIVGPITFSLYSRLGTSRQAVAAAFRKLRGPMLLCAAWAIVVLFILGPSVVHVLYDKRYVQAGWILQFLAISAWFEILENTSGSALLALGKAQWIATANFAKLMSMITLIPLAFSIGGYHGIDGFQAALVAVVLSEVVRASVMGAGVMFEGVGNVMIDLAMTAIMAATLAAGLLIDHLLQRRSGSPMVAALTAATVVTVLLAPAALAGLRSLVMPRRDAQTALSGQLAAVPAGK